MNREEIIEGNKLIAEFMGMRLTKNQLTFSSGKVVAVPVDRRFKYDSSWDFLMPVVEKIEQQGHNTRIFGYGFEQEGSYCDIVDATNLELGDGLRPTKIEAVWAAVVEFIKWHNSNPLT